MPHVIDTHTFLWFVDGAPELPTSVRHHIDNPAEATQISIASFWEIGIKAGLGKLPLTKGLLELEAIAARQSIEICRLRSRRS